jgi:hypothetical protein
MVMHCSTRRVEILRAVLAWVLLGTLGAPAVAQPAGNGESANAIPDLGVMWAKSEDEYRNPVLQPWVADTLKKYAEMDRSGVAPSPAVTSSCRPAGVPGASAPHYVLDLIQTPTMVVFLYNNNDQIRYIYLNQPHSKKLTPSWYGESVGHYEGDTLVVDTIGLAGKNGQSVMDTFGTPHTDALHVVERFHVINGGNTLRMDIHVEDPGAFTEPFNMYANLTKIKTDPFPAYIGKNYTGAFEERVCASNNRSHGVPQMPIADKPDF